MGEVKVWSHNVSLAFYLLTSLSFHVNRPSHSWDTTFSKFDLENPRSRSWKRWTMKVTTWVCRLKSLLFHVNLPSHSWDMTFSKKNIWPRKSKVKVMGEGNVESQSGCNILSIHIAFVPCQSALPFLRYSIFKIWPSKSKVKKVKWAWCCTTTGQDNFIELKMV